MSRVASNPGRVAGLGVVALVAAALVVALPGVALLLAPALLLFTVLLLGYAPGEELLHRMRARRFTRPVWRRAPRTLPVRRVVVVRRMASLATSALAMRPPPAAPAPIS